ncbi:MAG: glycosyltransferase family 9 protein [PVC group bacterium]|nr:glycosyltransferase family 9 protein [PVC group bacterium]
MNIAPDKIKKILVISLQGIGDSLLFSPCFPLLKKKFDRAEITVLTSPQAKVIFELNPHIKEVITYDSHKRPINLMTGISLWRRLVQGKFDLSICTFPTGMRSALIAYFSGIKLRCGHRYVFNKKVPWVFNIIAEVPEIKHVIELNFDLMNVLEVEYTSKDKVLALTLSAQEKNFVQVFLKENNIKEKEFLIGINPGTSILRKEKCWPLEKFNQLITMVGDTFKDIKIVLIGGPGEKELSKQIIETQETRNIIDATGAMSLRQTASLIQRCNLFIGNDSGLVHISGAVDTLAVAIFGPTDPRLYAPYGQGNLFINNELECAPCAYGVCGKIDVVSRNIGFDGVSFSCEQQGSFKCINSIEVDTVFELLKKMILGLK